MYYVYSHCIIVYILLYFNKDILNPPPQKKKYIYIWQLFSFIIILMYMFPLPIQNYNDTLPAIINLTLLFYKYSHIHTIIMSVAG